MKPHIQNVVVVGGGNAGFLSALTLKRMVPELNVTVVHSSRLPPIGVGESTTSLVPRFLHGGDHGALAIDQRSFYREVRPSWKLGIRFQEWGAPGTSHFYYPFDEQAGARTGTLPKEEAYYFFADRRVRSHYTAMMDMERSPCFPKPDGSYAMDPLFGYHIEARRFIRFLQTTAIDRGITVIDDEVKAVKTKSTTDGPYVDSIHLDGGRCLNADLFVDCTGFESRLLGETLGEPFVSYRESLFCDTAVTGSWIRERGALPYTSCQTMDHGWAWNIELADRVSCGYVFSSRFCTPEAAAAELKVAYPFLATDDASQAFPPISFRSGRFERFWVSNVAAIGNSAGFVEPLESTGLHMIAVTARKLAQALIDSDGCVTPSIQLRTNRFLQEAWDDIRDFLVIHFAFNHSRDTLFWRHCREATDLSGAQPIVSFYQENGPSSMGAELIPRNSIFRYDGYLSLLIGQQVPSRYDYRPSDVEQQQWQDIQRQIELTAARAVSMDDGLRIALPKE